MPRHGHSSSLYSASPASLKRQVNEFVDSTDPEANVLTYTEVGSRERTEVLKDADPDWAAYVPKESDVGIMWDRDDFSVLWKRSTKLTDRVWTDGQGRKHQTWCASCLLRHDSKKTLFVSVCHLPSHVQYGTKFYNNAQTRAWKDACEGWGDHWVSVRKQDHPDLGMIVADWNVDFHKDVWRDRVNAYFPKMHLGWKGNMPGPNQGTHGKRLIDGTLATSKARKCELLQDDKSSDHRPYGEVTPWDG